MEVVVFILVLALVFAAKAATIVLGAREEARKSASFSWVKPEIQPEYATPAWAVETAPRTVARPVFRTTHAHA